MMASISFSVVFLAYIVIYNCDASLVNIPTNLEEFEELGDNLQKLKATFLDQDQFPNPDVSFSCLQRIIQGIDIEAADAFGKPPAGLIGQNFNWLGHYDECVSIGGYRHSTVDLLLNVSTPLPIFYGVCLPDTCDEADIENLIRSAIGVLENANITLFRLNPNSPVEGPPGPIHTNKKLPYSAGFVSVVTACSVLGLLMLLGAAVDLYEKWFEHPEEVNGYQKLAGNDEESRTPLLSDAYNHTSNNLRSTPNTTENKKMCGGVRKFLLCFAVNKSLDKFLNASQGKDSIGCLNGIRVLSITWVILSHSVLYPMNDFLYYNMKDISKFIKRLDFTVILQGELAVDSFFFLSGFLLTYLSIKKMADTNGKLPWGIFYLHRYLRLTPLYAAVLVFYIFVDPYIGYGPIWYRYTDHPNCRKYWWRNLLYISNFFTNKEMCMTWSWYLPNDMQFFAISPLILVLLYRRPKLGVTLLSLLTMLSVCLRIGLSTKYGAGGIIAATAGGESKGFWNAVYDKPYTRINPYLVGMALGFGMARRPRMRLRPVAVLCGWFLATIVGLVVVYVSNNAFYRQWTVAEAAIYSGTSAFSWALCLSWVVLACTYGYGGWINTFLSWNAWLPIGRLTYSVYLVHPFVIRTIYYSTATAFRGKEITFVPVYISNLIISHAVALLFALAIEYPFANLEKLIIPSSLGKKYNNKEVSPKDEQDAETPTFSKV